MLTIIVSTYRDSQQVLANIRYLSGLAANNVKVIISDCSNSENKQKLITSLANNNINIKSQIHNYKIPLYTDISKIILEKTSESDFIAIVGDDDLFSIDYVFESVNTLNENIDAVCSYGNYVISLTNKKLFIDSRSSLENNAIERISKGFSPNYFNTMFFAVFRRNALLSWANFTESHPIPAVFFDFIHCLSLMAQGKIITHQKGHYLWTGENWDTPASNANSRSRHYQNLGLPEAFTLFHDLHFAIEIANFFLGKYKPIANHQENLICAQHGWDQCMSRFRNQLNSNQQLYVSALNGNQIALSALQALYHQNQCDKSENIQQFVNIISHFSPEHGRKYFSHFIDNNT